MARPISTGLDYFNMDVDFFTDDKVELISSEFGCKGESITIRLLCQIYRNGYFYQWGQDECLLFAKRVGNGITGSLVSDVVNGLVKRSFFDKRVFDKFAILTSRGIQRRYLEAKARAKEVVFFREILLLKDNEVFKHNNATLIGINDSINTQSKEKKRKVKESKGNAATLMQLKLPFESKDFFEKWNIWKSYREKEHRFTYRSAESEQAALNELINLAKGMEQTAIAIILQSMAKGWKGFFALKNSDDGVTTSKQPTGSAVSTKSAFDKIDLMPD